MATNRQLHALHAFDQIAFARAPCPAVLLAISGVPAEEILPAAQDAMKKVRGLETQADDIRGLTILEMDYAFTNLGFFMSCVGDYTSKSLTLEDWAKRPRGGSIFYAVQTREQPLSDVTQSHVAAVLGQQLVCCENRDVVEVTEASIAKHFVGQVFAITPMADARWSA